nr:3'-5' exonuclease [Neobacillus sp. Marseille-Q6967]
MKFIPSNYESVNTLGLSSNELTLLEKLKKYKNTFDSVILLKLYPINNIKLDICWIDNEVGLVPIVTVKPTNTTNIEQMFIMYENVIMKEYITQLETKFKGFKSLYNGEIMFPFGIMFYFENLSRDSFSLTSNFIENHCLFMEDINNWNNDCEIFCKFKNSLVSLPDSFEKFTDAQLQNLKFAICPEYTIPKLIKDEVDQDSWGIPTNDKLKITSDNGLNFYLETLELTQEQIDIVNNIDYGHELILAGAGSGKTVLLTSRAFRIAKANPDKDILLTCYNSPLAESVKLFLDTSGMRLRNLKNRTFHGLLIDLLERNGIPCHRTGNDQYFDKLFNTAVIALDEGKIKDRYYGIFIDEIQDFKPEWYKFLTRLIENKKEYFINICGDKTQDIRGIIIENGEPWNTVKEINYKDSKTILKKNFRYTKHLNNFTKAFGTASRRTLENMDIEQSADDELFISSKTEFNNTGGYPNVYKVDKYDEEINKVIECIEELHFNKKIPYSEIAVLFPYRKSERKSYFPYHFLLKALENSDIPFTDLSDTENNIASYYHRSGVVISTIHKSKGLDFQGVILFGLHGLFPFNVTSDSSKDFKNKFLKHVNLLYTAITRPSKFLSIVILDKNKNPYIKLFDETQLILKKVHKKLAQKRRVRK